MVDKKACKIRKRKYKINGAIFSARMTMLLVIIVAIVTIYNKTNKNISGEILESSAYIDVNGVSSMVVGVENGGVYTDSVTPKVTDIVEKASLSKNGKEIKFKSGRKISKIGSYVLTLEDREGNIDTVYFDIEK